MLKVILRNVAANWVGFATNVAVMFLLTPFVLRSLGETRYGVWALTVSIVGYYGLLDFGLRIGITQYLTRYRAREQYEAMNATMSSAVAMFTAIGFLVVLLSLLIAYLAPGVFDLEPELHSEVFWCILVVGASTGVQFALFPFATVFVATQRFDLSNFISVVTRLASAASIWLVLDQGHGLLGLTVVTALTNVVDYAIRWQVAYRILPQLRVRWELVNKKNAKEQLLFGVWSFLISANLIIFLHMDPILIGLFMPVAAITTYALAANLIRYIAQLIAAAVGVFYPAAAELDAQENRGGLLEVLYLGSRFLLVATFLSATVAGFWAEDFFRLWIGVSEIGEEGLRTVVLLVRVLAFAVALNFLSGTAGQILLGSGRVKALALISFGQALLNLVATVALIPRLGLLGAALGSLISVFVTRSLWPVVLVSRQLSTNLSTYVRKVLPRPLAFGILFAASAHLIQRAGPSQTWTQLLAQGSVAGLIGLVLALFVGLDRAERSQLLIRARSILPGAEDG
jgi:O-antigen/teichoic acid export membrane protein